MKSQTETEKYYRSYIYVESKRKKQRKKMIFVFTRGRGQEEEELGEDGQKVHISSYKINKYWI